MILVLNLCRERLHYFEFVRPVEDVLRRGGFEFFTRHYLDVKKGDIKNTKKVIICGTSLSDDKFLEDIGYFRFISSGGFRKPVLGICAGFQVLGILDEMNRQVSELDIKNGFGDVLKKKKEIGFFKERFGKEFLGLKGDVEVYHLHNNYVSFGEGWEVFNEGEIAQAVKLKGRDVYGALFHPEVRNKDMILEFCAL